MTERVQRIAQTAWRRTGFSAGERAVPEETAVAFIYDGGSYAVMMATPDDLEDFAVGFSLTEGVIASPQDIEQFEIVEQELGIELRMWLAKDRGDAHRERRRYYAGPTGCGLCGIETLEQAMRPPCPVEGGGIFQPQDIMRALAALAPAQALNIATRAVHATAFWTPENGLIAVREDVGRHNALDKLCGALVREDVHLSDGLLLFTSRVSIEMIQKAAVIGAPVVVAVSAPTTLAIRMADEAGITLIAVARDDGFEVFTHARRISDGAASHVA